MTAQVQRLVVLVFVISLAVVMPVALLPAPMQGPCLAAVGAVLLLASIWLWAGNAYLLRCKRRAGAVLLDLGMPRSEPAASAGVAVLSAGLAVWGLVVLGERAPLLALGYIGFGAHGLLQALLPFIGRVQLREHGIALPAQYVPWVRIGSYAVHDGMTHIDVAIRYRTWVPVWGYPWEVTLRCPADRWKALAAAMAQHIPVRLWQAR